VILTLQSSKVSERDKANLEITEMKKKPIKYPIEDLDVPQHDRAKKMTMKKRPSPKRDVPFGQYFESFVMAWNFLQVFG
jgi:bromodomain adjacent to zinc finger domain protein 1A